MLASLPTTPPFIAKPVASRFDEKKVIQIQKISLANSIILSFSLNIDSMSVSFSHDELVRGVVSLVIPS